MEKKSYMLSMLSLMRPGQWIKNIFVFTGVIFAKAFEVPQLLLEASLTAFAFCLVSSAVYIFNDIIDKESDKIHPEKKNRPLASGRISFFSAGIFDVFLLISGLLLGFFISGKVFLILILYVILNLLYCLQLKQVVILDVFCIATGFMLRILAGTWGIGIPPSKWLLLCGLMITLFLGFTKRRAESAILQESGAQHRKVLQNYGDTFLDQIIAICACCVIIGYSLYTMSPETIAIHKTDNLIYTVPFVIYALFRYMYLLYHEKGAGDPSTDIFKDRHILFSVFAWAALSMYLLSGHTQ